MAICECESAHECVCFACFCSSCLSYCFFLCQSHSRHRSQTTQQNPPGDEHPDQIWQINSNIPAGRRIQKVSGEACSFRIPRLCTHLPPRSLYQRVRIETGCRVDAVVCAILACIILYKTKHLEHREQPKGALQRTPNDCAKHSRLLAHQAHADRRERKSKQHRAGNLTCASSLSYCNRKTYRTPSTFDYHTLSFLRRKGALRCHKTDLRASIVAPYTDLAPSRSSSAPAWREVGAGHRNKAASPA